MKEIAVSGVRPTGFQHIGNYFGAVKNFVALQEQVQGYFFIADYHSLTTHPQPNDLRASIRQTLIEYLACGLDPKKCVLYAQSDVPQITELYLIFNTLAYLGELEKVPTFKDKVRSQPNNVNAALLTYPTLMAVDILIHHAQKVPVGKDQMQHIEMTRNFGNRFNHLYKVEYFKEPQGFSFNENPVAIPSLDGNGKMSKSNGENTCIYLIDDEKTIQKKVMRAVTDSGPTAPNSPKSLEIQNIFDLMALVSAPETIAYFDEQYANCSIRYGDLKKQLAADMIAYLAPITERIKEFGSDESLLEKILAEGAEQARASASKTVADVREIIGLKRRQQ